MMKCKICGAGIHSGDKVFNVEQWEVKEDRNKIKLLRVGGDNDLICRACYGKVFI